MPNSETRVLEACNEIKILSRTEGEIRVAFTSTVLGATRATDLGWMTPGDATIGLKAAVDTVESLGGSVTSISVYRRQVDHEIRTHTWSRRN